MSKSNEKKVPITYRNGKTVYYTEAELRERQKKTANKWAAIFAAEDVLQAAVKKEKKRGGWLF